MSQISRPEPFRDLDWSPEQARALGEDALDIWTDLIRGLHEDLPVIRNSSAAEVRQSVALDIPEKPFSREELSDYLRRVAVDDSQRMDVKTLRKTIAADINAGLKPICVVGSAGTTGTGAIDPLAEIADVCAEYDLWFHVDGAYGGAAALTDELAPLFNGIERADSVGFDPHKWLYTPLVGACVIVRDPTQLTRTFALDTSYIISDDEKTGWGIDSFQMGPQFSRPFAAFNIWVSILAHGWDAAQRRISHDVALARYLYEVAAEHPELETMNDPVLSITCFRYVPTDLAGRSDVDDYLNELNEKIMFELEVGGRVFPSNAIIEGRFALRSCIVNYRVEADNLDELVSESVRHGQELDSSLRPADLRSTT